MARPCTVCDSPHRDQINRGLVDRAGDPKRFRILSETYGPSPNSIRRHAVGHMTAGLMKAVAKHAELVQENTQLDVMASLGRAAQKLERFLAAADDWLSDPDNPQRYDLRPRDHEVLVIWEREVPTDEGRTRRVRKKERLTEILRRCSEQSPSAPALDEVLVVEANHGNPRKLLLDAMAAGKPLLELIGKATGQIAADAGTTVNVLVASPDWRRVEDALVAALAPWPPALEAAGKALAEVGGGR